jgi:ssDNA-binding Zn-finger/Zn-ribbon topoisomerase 1
MNPTFKCKRCNELKVRVQNGTFGNPKNKRHVDESGKQWSGRTCPDCHRNRSAVNMKTLRSKLLPSD